MATWIGTVDADYRIISSGTFSIGEKVIIMQPLLISDLLENPARRLRFRLCEYCHTSERWQWPTDETGLAQLL